jgi:hypothetical protein
MKMNKPLGLSPPFIEFKRAHLYDINPVGVGAMILATGAGMTAYSGVLGETLKALASFLAVRCLGSRSNRRSGLVRGAATASRSSDPARRGRQSVVGAVIGPGDVIRVLVAIEG